MKRPATKKRDSWNALVQSVFLRYIAEHPDVSQRAFFPIYFQQELEIPDSRVYLHRMIRRGYLQRKSGDIALLTDRGRAAIVEEYLRFFDFAGSSVTFSEYLQEAEKMKNEPFESVMLSALLQNVRKMKQKNDYVSVKNIHLDAAVLYEQLEIYDRAMYHYLLALYYDASGLEYYDQLMDFVYGKKKRGAAGDFYHVCIRPGVQEGIQRLSAWYEPQMVPTIYRKERIFINLCSQENFMELVEDLRKGAYDYMKWRAKFAEAFREMLSQAEQYKKLEKAT